MSERFIYVPYDWKVGGGG